LGEIRSESGGTGRHARLRIWRNTPKPRRRRAKETENFCAENNVILFQTRNYGNFLKNILFAHI
jgi:hypothetical protein